VAKFILRNAFIQVNGVNLSDHCSEVSVESTADKVDLTAFGAAGYRDYGQGFKDATITAKFYQDYGRRVQQRRDGGPDVRHHRLPVSLKSTHQHAGPR
jgi:hypothetical protein